MLSIRVVKKLVKKKLMSHPDRYKHTLGVVKMAKILAKKYNVSKYNTTIAALLHDYCKYDNYKQIEKKLSEEDCIECQKYRVLYHSYGAANFYFQLGGKNLDIYNAIRNHVFGRLNMTRLEEIILISDYTEFNRTYKSCIECREILLKGNLNLAIFESTKFVIDYLLKDNVTPHHLQYEILNYYEGLCKK